MKARGKPEARRPWLRRTFAVSTESAKYEHQLFRSFRAQHHCGCLPGATRLTLFGACPWLSYSAPSALIVSITLLHSDPLQSRREEFLFRIDRHHVGAEGADAPVGAKGDLRHQAGVVLVQPFESCNEALAAEVFAAELERMDQDFCRRQRRGLCCRMCNLELVSLQQGAVFRGAGRGNIGGNSGKREEDLVFRFDSYRVGDIFSNQCAEHVNRRRPTSSISILQHRRSFNTRTKKEDGIDSLLLQLGHVLRSSKSIRCVVSRSYRFPADFSTLVINARDNATVEFHVRRNDRDT